nr:Phl p6 allergen [Phleum pratense]
MAAHKFMVAMFLAVAVVLGLATSPTAEGGKATTEEQKLIEDVNASFRAAMATTANVPPADKYKTFEAAFTVSSKRNLADAVSKAPQLVPKLDEVYNAAYNAADHAAPEDKYEAFVLHFSEALRIIAGTPEVHAVKPGA